MPIYTDQMQRTLSIPPTPHRIVSLVPSQTELLHALGLENEVVGITKFCVHPAEWFRTKQRVGGTKNIHIDIVESLQPDLIIANKEENVKEQVEELAARFPVWISDVNDRNGALEMINSVGEITGRGQLASQLVQQIRSGFSALPTPEKKLRAAYLIWKDPWMTIVSDTFIHDMLQAAGFENVFDSRLRYPVITIEDLQQSGCDVLLLSSEPYPFRLKHIEELQALLPSVKTALVDGEFFSWYGSRLLQAPAYFQQVREQVGSML